MVRILEIKMYDCETGENLYSSKTIIQLSHFVLLRKDGLPKRIMLALQSFLRGVLSGRELQINFCLRCESNNIVQSSLF